MYLPSPSTRATLPNSTGARLICCFSLISLLSWFGASQAQAQVRFRVGLRAGANLSSAVGADADNGRSRFTYHGGLLTQLAFSERWAVQPEILYSVKGDQTLEFGPSIGAQLSYLEAPLLLRYTLDDAFMELGPHVSYLLSSRLNDTAVTILAPPVYQKLDYGITAGIGYQDPGGLSLSWRYVAGFANVYRPVEVQGVTEQVRIRNGVLQFSLGYRINSFSGLKKLNPFRRRARKVDD